MSETILLDSLYCGEKIVHIFLGYLHWSLQPDLSLRTFCGNLQYKDNAFY